MAFNYDFSKCFGEIRTCQVNPKGWVNPITIEYGVSQPHRFDTMSSVVWRVKGTQHTFCVYEKFLNELTHSKYEEHFEKTLEVFRKDYLSWWEEPEYEGCEWRDEYKRQFEKFIRRDEEGENKGNKN